VEREAALSSSREARQVVFDLFQNLNGFSLDDYQPFSDVSSCLNRLVPNLQNVPQMLTNGQLDAFATNKGILFDLSDRVPGSRVLAGSFTTERQSVAVPKGREVAIIFLERFLQDVTANGFVAESARRARARGLIIPDAR